MKKFLALFMVLAMAFSLIACAAPATTEEPAVTEGAAPATTDQAAPAATDAAAAPVEAAGGLPAGREEGTIIVVQSSDIISWDPTASTDVNTKNCMKNMLNRMFETDENLDPVPIMIESYEQVDDYNWTFKIYEGIKFFDGNECTTEDILFNLERSKTNSSSGKTLLAPIEAIVAVDDYTFTVKTSTIYGSLTTALSNTSCAILEKEWVEKADKGECDWDEVMRNGATGRYYLGGRVIGDYVELIKNPNYFNPDDAAKNEKLLFKIIPEATTRTIMLQSGDADLNVNFDTAAMDEVLKDPNLTLNEHSSSTLYYIALNTASAAFSNKLVRQAIAYAINRDDCLAVGYEGYGKVCPTVWAPTVYGYTDNPSGYTYDPAKAQELLTQAGVTSLTVKACCKTDAEERIAQVVQAYLAAVGITMEYTRIDNTILTEVMAANEYDMAFDYTAFYNDPELFYARQFSASGIGAKNMSHFDNAECDAFMEAAKGSLDDATRLDNYTKLHTMLCDECPWIGLFNSNLYCVSRTGLNGVNMNIETTYWYHTLTY